MTSWPIVGGGAFRSGTQNAPDDASYITIATSSQLSNERRLAAGTSISITDGGANGTVTIAVSGVLGVTDASYVTLGTNSNLTAERVLTAGSGISIADGGAGGNVTISATGALSVTGFKQTILPTHRYMTYQSASQVGSFVVPSGTLAFTPYFGMQGKSGANAYLSLRVSGSSADVMSFTSSLNPQMLAAATTTISANPSVVELWTRVSTSEATAMLLSADIQVT